MHWDLPLSGEFAASFDQVSLLLLHEFRVMLRVTQKNAAVHAEQLWRPIIPHGCEQIGHFANVLCKMLQVLLHIRVHFRELVDGQVILILQSLDASTPNNTIQLRPQEPRPKVSPCHVLAQAGALHIRCSTCNCSTPLPASVNWCQRAQDGAFLPERLVRLDELLRERYQLVILVHDAQHQNTRTENVNLGQQRQCSLNQWQLATLLL